MAAERTEGPDEEADVEVAKGSARRSFGPDAETKGVIARIAPGLKVSDAVGQTLLAAFVAWSATVAPAVLSRSAPRSAVLVALLALAAGLVGPMLRSSRPRLARHVGLTLFFVLITGAWLLASAALEPLRLDPLRASIGAIAWGAFALSWREPWEVDVSSADASEPGAPLLQARSALPRGAIFVMTVGVGAGLVFLVLAWNVRDEDRALVAHALAVACAVAIITVAASAAVERGRRPSRSNRRVTPAAGRALLLLFTFIAAGIAVVFLRR
ncbi:MAG: hypothetical protein IPM54_18050 [Polyangiaceae bacterium]|nr:hypothetical protein [Polyangiaceae bacterium]